MRIRQTKTSQGGKSKPAGTGLFGDGRLDALALVYPDLSYGQRKGHGG